MTTDAAGRPRAAALVGLLMTIAQARRSAPNLMVRATVESHGVRMPGFFAYVGGAIARVLPWLILPGLIVFA